MAASKTAAQSPNCPFGVSGHSIGFISYPSRTEAGRMAATGLLEMGHGRLNGVSSRSSHFDTFGIEVIFICWSGRQALEVLRIEKVEKGTS